jgi:cytochrome c5
MFTVRNVVIKYLAFALGIGIMSVADVSVPVSAEGTSVQSAASVQETDEPSETPPEFTEAYLADPANIELGKSLWGDLCRHCHGRSAYPGKAPKLKPRKYTPDFVFDRVTNGFRKMPAWGDSYSKEERMGVVAYVLSRSFSP